MKPFSSNDLSDIIQLDDLAKVNILGHYSLVDFAEMINQLNKLKEEKKNGEEISDERLLNLQEEN